MEVVAKVGQDGILPADWQSAESRFAQRRIDNPVNAGINRHEGVQRRLAYSVGDSSTRAKVRNPVAWIVRRKETESREPIDEAIEGW
jgi:hypothetical protein